MRVMIYAISLHQPWASFIAAGLKPYETRSWPAPRWLIGKRIAIHAAKKKMPMDDFKWALRHGIDDVPLGAIVCTAVLRGAYRIGVAQRVPGSAPIHNFQPDEFGDYEPGRWGMVAHRYRAHRSGNPGARDARILEVGAVMTPAPARSGVWF